MSSITASAQEDIKPVSLETLTAGAFKPIEYQGYVFAVPADCEVEDGASLTVRHPDGTFGIVITKLDAPKNNQKRVYELSRSLARKMGVKDIETRNTKINGMSGAISSGHLEEKDVSVLILPTDKKEFTAVLMASPEKTPWTDNFLRTLKKK